MTPPWLVLDIMLHPAVTSAATTRRQVHHRHNSPRKIRILQGVEYEEQNLSYMCTTCVTNHPARSAHSFNVLVGASNLHNINTPYWLADSLRSHYTRAWVGLEAWLWQVYQTDEDPPEFWPQWPSQRQVQTCDCCQHPPVQESGWLQELIPPRHQQCVYGPPCPQPTPKFLVGRQWLPPPNYVNFLIEIMELNSWIVYSNQERGKIIPCFHRFGVNDGTRRDEDGKLQKVKCNLMEHWRQTEPNLDKLHLSDKWRVRMGIAITRHFQGEILRFGVLG